MTQKTEGQLERVNVRLWRHDLDFLKARYPDNYNAQIRRIVGNWVVKRRRNGTPVPEEQKGEA